MVQSLPGQKGGTFPPPPPPSWAGCSIAAALSHSGRSPVENHRHQEDNQFTQEFSYSPLVPKQTGIHPLSPINCLFLKKMLGPGPAGRVIGKKEVLTKSCFRQQGGRRTHDSMFGRERLENVLNAQVFPMSVPVLSVSPSQLCFRYLVPFRYQRAETEGKKLIKK